MNLLLYKTLDGEQVKWKPNSSPRENASKLHLKAIELVRELMPTALICEECSIPTGIRFKNLYLDMLIVDFNLAIEVDGGQHDSFNIFFHKDKLAFARQKTNDRLKEEWCSINGIKLIRLKEKDGADTWEKLIILAANRKI